MLGPFRHCQHVKHLNHAAVALTNANIGEVITVLATRNYSDDKKGQGCCKDVVQTAGMKVEPWPKPDDSPQPWRAQCPQEPQPANYDPYRIKIPEPVVPPLPPSNVKRIGVLYVSAEDQNQQNQQNWQSGHTGYHQHPGYQQSQQECEQEEIKPGFFGRIKGFFNKLKGKGKEGEGDAMMTGSRTLDLLYR
ncbi:hypothetical protein PYW07_006205 [Mythimna separata]|uniref:Uncharacterized protein n=1 Tax=Mythimna separata TaxID=271217 RepID=A0AAD8DXF6_MYTSE|nr:hypothetical protein PYW07_006205 [Mythimna separata]